MREYLRKHVLDGKAYRKYYSENLGQGFRKRWLISWFQEEWPIQFIDLVMFIV